MAHDLERLSAEFAARFGRPPEIGARAPGRVNLIGEHTDYNGGLVLPCAIDRDTVVLAARRGDRRLRVHSRELAAEALLEAGAPVRTGTWSDYVAGVCFALAEAGHPVPGLDVAVASDVPGGAGLSSSAALEVAVALLCGAALGERIPSLEIARLAHRAESGFVGVACGRMDQLASALGQAGAALRIDCETLEIRAVPVPPAVSLLVVDSGVRHALSGGDYNQRRRECEAALAAARAAGLAPADAKTLRALGPDDLPALERVLDPLLLRRARHVLTENVRVETVCAALASGNPSLAGIALGEGQASLRDDFEVSVPELDLLCEIAAEAPGVYGARLTGAGFGGCTVQLCASERADAAQEAIQSGFEARRGRRPRAWCVRPSAGASLIPLPRAG